MVQFSTLGIFQAFQILKEGSDIMRDYIISCCSTADLTEEHFKARDISYICFHFELNGKEKLTEQEKVELEAARKTPVAYDEDSPELDEAMEKAFREVRKKKPLGETPLTVFVSSKTLEKAKAMGDNYEVVLGKLLDKAVEDYLAM